MKEESKGKKEADEVDGYMTEEQLEEIRMLQEELKRLKGKRLADDELDSLRRKIKELKRPKQPKSKALKAWVGGIERFIKWWNMENLTPEEREAKRKRFSQATNSLFDVDERGKGEIPALFDDFGGGSGPPMGFLDELEPGMPRNRKSQSERGDKQRKKGVPKQKRSGGRRDYVVIDGVKYFKADKATSAKKTRKKQKKPQDEESDDEDMPFFDFLG